MINPKTNITTKTVMNIEIIFFFNLRLPFTPKFYHNTSFGSIDLYTFNFAKFNFVSSFVIVESSHNLLNYLVKVFCFSIILSATLYDSNVINAPKVYFSESFYSSIASLLDSTFTIKATFFNFVRKFFIF